MSRRPKRPSRSRSKPSASSKGGGAPTRVGTVRGTTGTGTTRTAKIKATTATKPKAPRRRARTQKFMQEVTWEFPDYLPSPLAALPPPSSAVLADPGDTPEAGTPEADTLEADTPEAILAEYLTAWNAHQDAEDTVARTRKALCVAGAKVRRTRFTRAEVATKLVPATGDPAETLRARDAFAKSLKERDRRCAVRRLRPRPVRRDVEITTVEARPDRGRRDPTNR